MKKIRLIGLILSVVIIAVISELNNITLFSKFGGITLIPVLYFLVTYVVPYMFKDYVNGWKEIINDGEVCFTKGEKYRRWFEEATGKEVETLETTIEGEEIESVWSKEQMGV